EIYTLSLHDALPILPAAGRRLGAIPAVPADRRSGPGEDRRIDSNPPRSGWDDSGDLGTQRFDEILKHTRKPPLAQHDQVDRRGFEARFSHRHGDQPGTLA